MHEKEREASEQPDAEKEATIRDLDLPEGEAEEITGGTIKQGWPSKYTGTSSP